MELGGISPGKTADILLIDDLLSMVPSVVITDGEVVAENGRLVKAFPVYQYPEKPLTRSRQRPLTADDFLCRGKFNATRTEVNVVRVIENSARTAKMTAVLSVEQGVIQPDLNQDVVQLACIERHSATGQISLGFASGFGLKSGAVASTVAHDSHNLLVMGTNAEDMALAANELAACGGGMIVVRDGRVLAKVAMPIAGLLADRPVEIVAEEVAALEEAWKELGCFIHAPFMTFAHCAAGDSGNSHYQSRDRGRNGIQAHRDRDWRGSIRVQIYRSRLA